MTTESESNYSGQPLGLALTELLGLVPDYIRNELPDDLAAQRVQAWADARVLAERERCAAVLRAAAARLTPAGKRANQVDMHVAHVLERKADELMLRPNVISTNTD